MGKTAILLNGAEPFEQIVNIHLTEGPIWNLMKPVQAVSQKKIFKDFTIFYMCIARTRANIPKNLEDSKTVLLLKSYIVSFSHKSLLSIEKIIV